MPPELRAAADRLFHTEAYLRHLVAEMRPNEHERHCKATGLSVRQTIGHMAQWLEQEVGVSERFLAGEPAFEGRFDEDAINARFAEASRETPIAELVARFADGRRLMFGIYGRVTPEVAAAPVGETTFEALTLQWTSHYQHHAVDFAEALPRLRFDQLLLDWALSPRSADPSEAARQDRLAEAARAHLKSREEADAR